MMRRTWLAIAAAVSLTAAGHAAAAPPPAARSAVVVGVIGETDPINVLHEDFAAPRKVVYPPGMPRPVFVDLPRRGDFAERLEALRRSPLGSPRAGTLYAIRGTRLLLYSVTGDEDFLGADRLHATGVVSSVIGRKYGTAPDAIAVHIPGVAPAGYDWLAEQEAWIDVATTSVYAIRGPRSDEPGDTLVCLGADPVRSYVADGHIFFTSSGNTTDQPEPLLSPNGLPEAYQVGGADASGRTWLPGHLEEADPFYAFGNVVRPYETSELFSFTAADADALTGGTQFGGTSGATPRTAGRAAQLIAHARAVLGGGARPGALASLGTGTRAPRQGPLADGSLTGQELEHLLRQTAVPAEATPGLRYAIEGYGALTNGSLNKARDVLSGRSAPAPRDADDEAHAAAEQARGALFDQRC